MPVGSFYPVGHLLSSESLDALNNFLTSLGIVKGLFALFFIIAHLWIYGQYRGRLNDRQKEIDRLAEDNRRYREIYLKNLDEKFGYKKQ